MAKTRMCQSCGMSMFYCRCGFQSSYNNNPKLHNYKIYDSSDFDEAETSSINRTTREESQALKQLVESFPQNNEELSSWLSRTDAHCMEIIEYARWYHVFGTKRPWPSHTRGRYCIVCVLCQLLEMIRTYSTTLLTLLDPKFLKKLRFSVSSGSDGLRSISLRLA